MNEVEKLMQNANIKQDRMCEWTCKGNEFCSTNCEHYESTQLYYPPFTAEKQLELIKWLAYKMYITIGKGLPWGQYDDDWWTVTSKKGYAGTNAYKLEEALANFVNCLWQDLTEEERKQIRNILE